MKSRLASAARRERHEELLAMSAEQRLGVFVAHCQIIVQLYRAGQAMRQDSRRPAAGRSS